MIKIIRVGATWCPSCLIMNNRYKKMEAKYPLIEYIKYDYDFDEDEVSKLNVGKILPVLIIYKDEKELRRVVGETNEQVLLNIIGEVYEEN